MSDRIEIRLSGSGGQGMVLGAIILAEAAAIYDGKNATQSQSYGPEARGGSSVRNGARSQSPSESSPDSPGSSSSDSALSGSSLSG